MTRRDTWLARTWWRLSGSASALAALLWLVSLGLVAAFAPFLSHDRPITIVEDGRRTWPLLRALGAEDVLWLAAAGAAFAAWFGGRLVGRSGAALAGGLVFSIGALAAWHQADYLDTRRYAAVLEQRRELAVLDEDALAPGALDDRRPLGRLLDAYTRTSARFMNVELMGEIARRVHAIQSGDPNRRAVIAELAARNRNASPPSRRPSSRSTDTRRTDRAERVRRRPAPIPLTRSGPIRWDATSSPR